MACCGAPSRHAGHNGAGFHLTGSGVSQRIVCFGELLLRLSAPGRERALQTPRLDVHIGGAEANVAVSLAHFGLESVFLTCVPGHAIGAAAVAVLPPPLASTNSFSRSSKSST